MNSSSPENPNGKKYSPVFIYSAIVVAIVVLLGAFLPEQFNHVTNNIKNVDYRKVRLVLSYSYYDYRVLLYIPYF